MYDGGVKNGEDASISIGGFSSGGGDHDKGAAGDFRINDVLVPASVVGGVIDAKVCVLIKSIIPNDEIVVFSVIEPVLLAVEGAVGDPTKRMVLEVAAEGLQKKRLCEFIASG